MAYDSSDDDFAAPLFITPKQAEVLADVARRTGISSADAVESMSAISKALAWVE